jgi:hypothetical protein
MSIMPDIPDISDMPDISEEADAVADTSLMSIEVEDAITMVLVAMFMFPSFVSELCDKLVQRGCEDMTCSVLLTSCRIKVK